MRMSDWSSDVCSSDLDWIEAPGWSLAHPRHSSRRPDGRASPADPRAGAVAEHEATNPNPPSRSHVLLDQNRFPVGVHRAETGGPRRALIGRACSQERVCQTLKTSESSVLLKKK